MDLAQILSPEKNSKILYLRKQNGVDEVIYQNEHHTWLTIDSVVQSAVDNHAPFRPILPHCYVMLLPLLHDMLPKTVIELGAGGLSINRYLSHAYPAINIHSIDINAELIDAVKHYFPSEQELSVEVTDAYSFIDSLLQRQQKSDWLIVDLFYGADSPILNDSKNLFGKLAKLINQRGWLVLNLLTNEPSVLERIDAELKDEINGKHYRFNVPHMQNQIILIKVADKGFEFPKDIEQHNLFSN